MSKGGGQNTISVWKTKVFDFYSCSPRQAWHFHQGLRTCNNATVINRETRNVKFDGGDNEILYLRNINSRSQRGNAFVGLGWYISYISIFFIFYFIFEEKINMKSKKRIPLWAGGGPKVAEVHGELDLVKFLLQNKICLRQISKWSQNMIMRGKFKIVRLLRQNAECTKNVQIFFLWE